MPLLVPCFLLLLGAATIAVVTLCVVGRRDPARPRCAACRTDLAPALLVPADPAAPPPCPSCAASLAAPRAIRPARQWAAKRTWGALVIVLVLWPLVISLMTYGSMLMMGPPGAMAVGGLPVTLPVDQLVERVVQESGGSATMQAEFARRLGAGEVDLDVARRALLAELPHLATRPLSTRSPGGLVVATPLLERNPKDTELMDALLDAFQPAPTLQISHRDAKDVHVLVESSSRGDGSPHSLQTVLVLRRVVADGRDVPFAPLQNARGPSQSEMLILSNHAPPSRTVRLDVAALAGAVEIELHFDALLYDSFDAQRMSGMAWSGATFADWPAPLRSQARRATLRLGGGASPGASPPASTSDASSPAPAP